MAFKLTFADVLKHKAITIQGISHYFSDVRPEGKLPDVLIDRDRVSELISQLRTLDLTSLSEAQVDRIINFLQFAGDDEVLSFLTVNVIDKLPEDELKAKPYVTILTAFKPLLQAILPRKDKPNYLQKIGFILCVSIPLSISMIFVIELLRILI